MNKPAMKTHVWGQNNLFVTSPIYSITATYKLLQI